MSAPFLGQFALFWHTNWLSVLLWGSLAFSGIAAIELLLACANQKRFLLGWASLLVSTLALLAYVMANMYTGAGINEAALFQLQYGLQGVTWQQAQPLLVLAGFAGFAWLLLFEISRRLKNRRMGQKGQAKHGWWFPVVYLLAISSSPAIVQGATMASYLINRPTYQRELAEQIKPMTLPVKLQGTPKSVVYLYLESLEATFLDEKAFPGLTPNLNALRKRSLVLDNLHQAPFTGWTIAGMVASQCGFPALGNQDFSKHGAARGLVCVGNIMRASGYQTSYINGADLLFAGQGNYYREHGFEHVMGRDELRKGTTLAAGSQWGLYDDDLLGQTELEFDRLSKSGKPFLLVSPTLDTHEPAGYATPYCNKIKPYGDGKNGMLNAVHCSDALIGQTIARLEAKGIPNVVFVLGSDHLQPDSSVAIEQLRAAASQRRDLWMVHGTGIQPEVIQRAGTTFDIGPTLLSAIGFDTPQINLGRDLRRPAPSMVEHFGEDGFFKRVQSTFIVGRDGFWQQASDTIYPPAQAAEHKPVL